MKPLDVLSGGDRDIARAECLTARRERLLQRFLLEQGILLALADEAVAASGKLGARLNAFARNRCPSPSWAERFAVRARITGSVELSSKRTRTSSSVPPLSASTSNGGRRAIVARPASRDDTGCCSAASR